MPIIARVGRKSLRVRLLIGSIYGVLCLGAITMIYPLILMLSLSVSTRAEYSDYSLIPRYLINENWLILNYVYLRENMAVQFQSKYGELFTALTRVMLKRGANPPDFHMDDVLAREGVRQSVVDWHEFKPALPAAYKSAYFVNNWLYDPNTEVGRLYRRFLKSRHGGNIEHLNKGYRENNMDFYDVMAPGARNVGRTWRPGNDMKSMEWYEFLDTLEPRLIQVIAHDPFYQYYLRRRFRGDVSRLNTALGKDYASLYDIQLPETCPIENEKEAQAWTDFVLTQWPLVFLELTDGGEYYQAFLRSKYGNTSALNEKYGSTYQDFSEIRLPRLMPKGDNKARDWRAYVETDAPASSFRLLKAETFFHGFLREKYGAIEDLNAAYGSEYTTFERVKPPYLAAVLVDLKEHYWATKLHLLFGNYVFVVQQFCAKGRAFLNTLIVVVGLLAAQLTVNPLGAYALARFKLRYRSRLLLFLLVPMAFPTAVTMIPNFLMLRELGLLNRYWALILPVVAQGYFIFLLYGFFSNLPQELFEAGALEGASELRMFWQVAVPLSKPIFAVIAIGAFTRAYSMFMWPLIVCQDPKMWTLMVSLFEFQQRWGLVPPLIMASLVLAGIPTLLVFLFCQRIIIRGIIIPTLQ